MLSTRGHRRVVVAVAALSVALAPALASAGTKSMAGTSHARKPTRLVALAGNAGIALEWDSTARNGFEIEQATDAAMNQGVRTYKIRGPANEFTPYGLTVGQTYYFRVSALGGHHHSAWSNKVNAATHRSEQAIRVMTYNILEDSRDGKPDEGGIIAPWSKRLPGAAKLVAQTHPDMVAIEEGSDFVSGSTRIRQVDSLVSALGSPYALANTEIAPPKPHYFRTGVYIIYNSDAYKPIGKGWHWKIGNPHWAAYQTFENLTTGAKFIFVSTHLFIGFGHAADEIRLAETKTLIKKSRAYAHKKGLPLIYAGDFNSATAADPHFTFDAAAVGMRAAHIADGFLVAQSLTHGQYNSANQYFRRPKKTGDRIDHIFAPPGIAVKRAGIVLDLRHGKFVGPIPSDHNPMYADLFYPYQVTGGRTD